MYDRSSGTSEIWVESLTQIRPPKNWGFPEIGSPLKLVSSRNKIFRKPHRSKSADVNEVATKDISGVHGGISRELNDWFPSVCPVALRGVRKNCAMKRTQLAVPPGRRLQYIVKKSTDTRMEMKL